MNDTDERPTDELDREDVRARLAAIRRRDVRYTLIQRAMTPLTEGQTPDPAPLDAFGRGPGSPFYQPDVRPPWAPDWDPLRALQASPDEYGRHYLGGPDDDDGIEWRFQ